MYSDSLGFDPELVRDLLKQSRTEEAVGYMEQFVARGSVRAMIAMADYAFDQGDQRASLAWMERAEGSIAEDDFESPIYLASAWRRGLGAGTAEERYFKALALREHVAESGNLAAIREMMANYLYGLNGALKDRERLIYWTKKAAALGDQEAQRVLRDEGLA